jgi:hypothetical protein
MGIEGANAADLILLKHPLAICNQLTLKLLTAGGRRGLFSAVTSNPFCCNEGEG